MSIQDRRVRRTQNALATALIELTLAQGYEAITIRDITERADIGYATFFRHYADKDALLYDALEVVLNELMNILLTLPNDPATVGTILFTYVQKHHQIIHVILHANTSVLLNRIIEAGTQDVLSKHVEHAHSPVPIAIAANHIVTSCLALIQWWLDHDMPYPPEHMGLIYRDLIILPTQQLAFQS